MKRNIFLQQIGRVILPSRTEEGRGIVCKDLIEAINEACYLCGCKFQDRGMARVMIYSQYTIHLFVL